MDTKSLLRNAQFHGAKRLIEPRHRIFWAVGMAAMLACALANLAATVSRFIEAPTHLIAQDTVSTRMMFPSVLVCPEVYYPDYKIEAFLEHAKYPAGTSADSIRLIIQQLAAFFSPDVPFNVKDLMTVQNFFAYNSLDAEAAGLLLTPTCEETLLRCRYDKQDYDCLDIFHMEITSYGLCCTFNGRSLRRDMKLGANKKAKKLRMWHLSETGPLKALVVAVNQSWPLANVDLSYKWIVIQKNRRYVDETNNGTALSPGTEMWTSFHMEYLQVTEDSRFLGDSLRGCHIENKGLKYFQVYNKKDCLLECKVQNLFRTCRCLLPVHYRPRGVPLCSAQSLSCARKSIGTVQFDEGGCDCPLSCNYQFELLEMEVYDLSSRATPVDSFYSGLNLSRVTVARVFLKSHQTTTFYRHPLFNFHDLFAQLGGVFGVFFGCSVISILELLQLAWFSVKCPHKPNIPKIVPIAKRKRKKVTSLLFGLCCRSRKGLVGKRVTKKKVTFSKQNKKLLLKYKDQSTNKF